MKFEEKLENKEPLKDEKRNALWRQFELIGELNA